MKSAKVSLEIIWLTAGPVAPPTRTQCGVARSFPPVATSSASPVWKARQSAGMETFVKLPPRLRIYKPEVGEGEGTIVGSELGKERGGSRRNMAYGEKSISLGRTYSKVTEHTEQRPVSIE